MKRFRQIMKGTGSGTALKSELWRAILSAAAYLTVWTTGRLHTVSSFRLAHYFNKFKSVDLHLRTWFQFYCMFYSLFAPPG